MCILKINKLGYYFQSFNKLVMFRFSLAMSGNYMVSGINYRSPLGSYGLIVKSPETNESGLVNK